MTRVTRTATRPRWAPALQAAILAILVTLFGAGSVSAATASAAQTRVGVSQSTAAVLVGSSANISAGERLGNDTPRPGIVVATGVAAETAAGTVSSTVRVGPGAALENISSGEALRIQNAANRIGEPISLVGSRASGTAGAHFGLGLRDLGHHVVDEALGVQFASSGCDRAGRGASDRHLHGAAR